MTETTDTAERLELDDALRAPAFEYLQRLGDDALVLGHRLSEWCGHGPMLEEDIAMANIALDCLGHANAFLDLAAQAEDAGRDADALAFLRDVIAYRNVLMAELPRGDFAFTTLRQFFFSVYVLELYRALGASTLEPLAGIAAKAHKETRYHVRHTGEWVVRLGDGTQESRDRMQDALERLWIYTGELFESDDVAQTLAEAGVGVDPSTLREAWLSTVSQILERATLTMPDPDVVMQTGGRKGHHTEHLGHMLAVMQSLPRQYPDATW